MRLSPVFTHDERTTKRINFFLPKVNQSFERLKYKTANDSTLYDHFSPDPFSIFRAVCLQKVAKSYQESFLGYLYLFLLTISQFGYECQIRKKETIQFIKI